MNKKKAMLSCLQILLGSMLYGIGTVLFVFPSSLSLGGTSGIAVMLARYLPPSAGFFSVLLNVLLLMVALFVLGRSMAARSFLGSALTTAFIGGVDAVIGLDAPLIGNVYLAALAGGATIALASAILFLADSSSGGTDIVALIVKKYARVNIGKALLLSDFLIVAVGGILTGISGAVSSFFGFLVKTLGIDLAILLIEKVHRRK